MHRPLHRGIARMLLFPRVASSYFARERAVVRAASAGNPKIALIISDINRYTYVYIKSISTENFRPESNDFYLKAKLVIYCDESALIY